MAAYASAANLVSTAAQAILNVSTVRLTLPYLGEERFGIWMTVLGISGLLTFADMGIGNSLVARVAASKAKSAGAPLKVVVTGGLAVLLLIGMCTSIVLSVICYLLPWPYLFRVPLRPMEYSELRSAASLFGFFFGCLLFTSGVRKVYDGLQKGYLAHITMAITSCVSLILMCVMSRLEAGVPILLSCSFGMTAMLPVVLLVPLYRRSLFCPARLVRDGLSEWRHLIGAGAQYTVVQIGSLIMHGSEPMLVSSLQGAGALASLTVAQKLFVLASTPTRIIAAPYWGAYADAKARGDAVFVRRTLLAQLLAAGLLTSCIAIPLALYNEQWVALLTRNALRADPNVVAACCALCLVDGLLLPFGIYLNGTGCVRPQAIATAVAFFTYFPVKVFALMYGGVAWMIWTTVVFQVVYSVLFYGFVFRAQVWQPVRRVVS
jgi:O-antigen/teichoic acid export membrane protein